MPLDSFKLWSCGSATQPKPTPKLITRGDKTMFEAIKAITETIGFYGVIAVSLYALYVTTKVHLASKRLS